MSRFETSMTLFGTMLAFMAGHLVCCGILPLMLNASTHAVAGAAGFDALLAVITVPATAYAVTMWEKRRHHTVCHRRGSHCSHRNHFGFKRHFIRNLLIGTAAFLAFHLLFDALGVHGTMPRAHMGH